MPKLKTIFILLLIFTLITSSFCEKNPSKKKKKYYKHSLRRIFGPMILPLIGFIILKLKLVFFLGTFFAVILAGAKLYGLYRLIEFSKGSRTPEIIDHGGPVFLSKNPYEAGSDFGSSSPYTGYNPNEAYQETYDHPPPGASDSYNYPGRSLNSKSSSLRSTLTSFKELLSKTDLSEMVFGEMKMSFSCRQRLVCEVEFKKSNIFLRTAYNFISDESFLKYRPKETVKSIEDCEKLYPTCEDYTNEDNSLV